MPTAIATTENLRQVSPTVKALIFLQMAAAIKGNLRMEPLAVKALTPVQMAVVMRDNFELASSTELELILLPTAIAVGDGLKTAFRTDRVLATMLMGRNMLVDFARENSMVTGSIPLLMVLAWKVLGIMAI